MPSRRPFPEVPPRQDTGWRGAGDDAAAVCLRRQQFRGVIGHFGSAAASTRWLIPLPGLYGVFIAMVVATR